MTGSLDRSQSGLDRLLLFVVAVVALVVVVPIVLGLAGVDVRGTASGPGEPSDHDLTILAARGGAIAGDGSSVGVVRLYVAPNHDRAPVDLRDGSAMLVTDTAYDLAPDGTDREGVDGTFAAGAANGGGTVLQAPTDRGVLTFDLGSDDGSATAVGDRLAAGETATIVLVTPRGEQLTRDVTVPASIPSGRETVPL